MSDRWQLRVRRGGIEFRNVETHAVHFADAGKGDFDRIVTSRIRKDVELLPGVLADLDLRIKVPLQVFGRRTVADDGSIRGFEVVREGKAPVVLHFTRKRAPLGLVKAIKRAFEPAPKKEKRHGEGQQQVPGPPAAQRRAEAEGARQEHPEGEQGGEVVLGSRRRQHPGQERKLSKASSRSIAGKKGAEAAKRKRAERVEARNEAARRARGDG